MNVFVVLAMVACIYAKNVEEFDEAYSSVTRLEPVSAKDGAPIAGDLEEDSNHVKPQVKTCCGSTKIAFSAYLSADYTCLRNGQHVQFDKVLLNDGRGYSPSTGIFRAPKAGVYVFTYVVAQRGTHEIRVKLVRDGETINSAVAETRGSSADAQGTNTAVIYVKKGQQVWIEAQSGNHLEGDNYENRFTTFSGYFLY